MIDLLSCSINGANFGDGGVSVIPAITRTIVLLIQVAIPIILIFLGMLDLGKAVMSNDEKVMKESQGKLIKRIIYAVLVFLVVAIVKLLVGVLNDADAIQNDKILDCIDCFVSDETSC